jgi:DNA-binding transcriptional MerR regulator
MSPNEEFALACLRYYEEQGIVVDATNGQFAHCPLPRGMGDKGYYLLWEHHQQQGLLQSRDVGRRCFWSGHAKQWLQGCAYWPDNYFELWDIYEQFSQPDNLDALRLEPALEKMREGVQSYWDSDKSTERRSKMKQIVAPNARKVEVTFSSGMIGVYASCKLASLALGVSAATITNWGKGKHISRFSFHKVRYV